MSNIDVGKKRIRTMTRLRPIKFSEYFFKRPLGIYTTGQRVLWAYP